jgi:hypothetical protein
METPWPPVIGKETRLITPKEALRIVLKCARPLKASRKPLHEALNYCLAEDVLADRDLPPANCSAMDGYAVRSRDLAKCPCRFRLIGEVAAGSAARARHKCMIVCGDHYAIFDLEELMMLLGQPVRCPMRTDEEQFRRLHGL